MGQGKKVSVEAALVAFRQRHGELADENVLLKARVSELEEENARLQAGGQGPASGEEQSPPSAFPLGESA